MNNPHHLAVSLPERIAPDALMAAKWLHAMTQFRGQIRIATIGPVGTSAQGVLNELRLRFPNEDTSSLKVQLFPSFDDTMRHVLEGAADYALIPSAYRDATAFHWHPKLELACIFVHRTPDYGLAARHDANIANSAGLVVAAMSEVEGIFSQLAPDNVLDLQIEYLKAPSTSEAAAIVGAGGADIAVCNDLGRQEHGLTWINKREGVEMVWMFFQRVDG